MVLNHHSTSFPLTRNFRPSHSTLEPSNKKWKILCFRREEFGYGDSKPEFTEDPIYEELAKPKLDESCGKTKDWVSSLQEAADAVFRAIGKPWTVPWTAETILQACALYFMTVALPRHWISPLVTLLWIVAFWFVGSWMIPFGAHIAGFSKESLTYRGQALYSLLTDVTEGLAGIAILHRCLSRFCPLPSDWFKFSLRGNWLFDVALGCLMFPLVNRLSKFNLDLLPLLPSTPVTLSNVEQSIVARDPIAMALYALVVSVCAPVWEEIVFRGFLLPSLTKYMPVWCSDSTSYFSWRGDGCNFCTLKEPIAIYALAQSLEWLCFLGFDEIEFLLYSLHTNQKSVGHTFIKHQICQSSTCNGLFSESICCLISSFILLEA
ncbi:unnamed protein product [Camellia sinensis]